MNKNIQMNTTDLQEEWDSLSQYYSTFKVDHEIPAGAADNILIAWPVFIDFIRKYILNIHSTSALDFGCGSGSFCVQLDSMGFKTTGIDFSNEMIQIAKANAEDGIDFYVGESDTVASLAHRNGKFDLFVSIMTFQFIADMRVVFRNVYDSLPEGGLLIFAVFNPDWIKSCLRNKKVFHVSQGTSEQRLCMNLGLEKEIPVYERTSKEYDQLLGELGFTKLLEAYPPFTKKFIDKYNPRFPTDVSEFMILGYQK